MFNQNPMGRRGPSDGSITRWLLIPYQFLILSSCLIINPASHLVVNPWDCGPTERPIRLAHVWTMSPVLTLQYWPSNSRSLTISYSCQISINLCNPVRVWKEKDLSWWSTLVWWSIEVFVLVSVVTHLDSLMPLTAEEKKLLWDYRESLIDDPRALPKFLLSVNWTEPSQIAETYRLLESWSPLTPVQALQVFIIGPQWHCLVTWLQFCRRES